MIPTLDFCFSCRTDSRVAADLRACQDAAAHALATSGLGPAWRAATERTVAAMAQAYRRSQCDAAHPVGAELAEVQR